MKPENSITVQIQVKAIGIIVRRDHQVKAVVILEILEEDESGRRIREQARQGIARIIT